MPCLNGELTLLPAARAADARPPRSRSPGAPQDDLAVQSCRPPRPLSPARPAPLLDPRRGRDDTARRSRIHRSLSPSTIPASTFAAQSVPLAWAGPDERAAAPPVSPPAASADRPDIPCTKPLLQHASLYSNSLVHRDDDDVSLEGLAHVVRLSKYQERKRASTRTRLQRTLISTALSARLTRCGEVAHRNLAESFRRDHKEGFVTLYNAIHDVRKSCDELRRYALLEPELSALSPPSGLASPADPDAPGRPIASSGPFSSAPSFLHDIPTSVRDVFLDFLTQLRTNPDYLASRICALNSSELGSLLSFHRDLEPVDSVLPSHRRSPARSQASASGRSSAHADIERLLSFHRHDALSILIHTCFANSAGPDSSEDQRRTDIWATVLARLISEPKSTGEHLLIAVLNIWTTMRDWSGKCNMEWYLMKILKDGAFLLDRAEDQHGTRFNLSDWTPSDEVAAKEFYGRAINDLFELVDDEDATGIPEGLLELGNAVLKKLDDRYVGNTSRWLVWRCLFFVFLLGVIVHPESYGMLSEYYVTPYAREKILKKVAMKAHEYVSSMWSGKPSATCVPVDVPPKVKGHVESILARLQGSRSKAPAPKLLPARSITSLRETMEVHPYLVISPADLGTLVNALFPEKRPRSALSGSCRSGPASVSGMSAISQPFSVANLRNNLETASIISTSASSVLSDAMTSREAPGEDSLCSAGQRQPPPFAEPEAQGRQRTYEDEGYRLRLGLREMVRSLGDDAVHGFCHPCAERWAVVFVSADGQNLTTHMTYDEDDDLDEEDSSDSDVEDVRGRDGPELDKNYHQLRDSILRLMEDYEIPRALEPENGRTNLSNRASGLKRYKSKNVITVPGRPTSSQNPYRRRKSGDADAAPGPPAARGAGSSHSPDVGDQEPQAVLITMLRAASQQSRAQADFVSSHEYWKTLKQLNALTSASLRENGFAALINILSRGPKDSIRRSAAAIEEYDAWLVWLKQSQERHEGLIDRLMKRITALRDKMWYVADVRNSKEYEHSRDICQALKTMGMRHRWSTFQRSRSGSARGQSTAYLYRTESQILDLLAASEDQGELNKLSDDQAEMTSLWLRQSGIENFCPGEERIHRFCCEVDKCISKLVGETIREAPVLWSSELYKRDKKAYEQMKAHDRDHAWSADEASGSAALDGERRYASSGGRPGSLARDIRNLPAYNASQHSLDSARHSYPRAGTGLSDILDGHDHFDKASPLHTMDPLSTFWSPFQPAMSPGSVASRAYSPTTSLTNVSTTFSGPQHLHYLPSSSSFSTGRPGTSASSSETVFQHRGDDDRTRFLNELRQSLTSLLLSDLGNQVFARGSETDVWFRQIGQQCIDRKDAMDHRARRRTEKPGQQARGSNRPRVIEKKKCCDNLRGAGEEAVDWPAGMLGEEPHAGRKTPTGCDPNDADGAKMDSGKADFPFKAAYQRLLNMFSVHPNPFVKLNVLNELEQLIVASLACSGARKPRRWNRSEASSAVSEEQSGTNRLVPSKGAVDNVSERGPNTFPFSHVGSGTHQGRQPSAETRSNVSGSQVSSDAVTRELQKLFRDASIRPSSLFRDLQLIASFVPSSILDKSERGKPFMDAGLAALKLKDEVCRTMVEMADEVIMAQAHGRSSTAEAPALDKSSPSSTGTPPPPSKSYSLDDVGKMWTITAKEGYPAAQRELALFYLSNPEFVERTTLPLSKPRDVFKQSVMEKYGRHDRGGAMGTGAGSRFVTGQTIATGDTQGAGIKEGDVRNDVRNDPGLMCVAVHWMEAAERGGDELATSFLRQNEFMGRS